MPFNLPHISSQLYKDKLSDKYLIKYGTPQGSVLGPLMYIILANDLTKSLKFCSGVTFADDTTIYASGNSLKFLYKKVNEDLRSLSSLFNGNSLTLNIEKSRYIIFRSKRNQVNYNGKLDLNGQTIPQVKSIKFLGIMLDEFLEWTLQVKHMLTKVIAGNYSLNMIKNIIPTRSKLQVYYCNVQSHLAYAISAWGPMLKSKDLQSIRKQQNK